jgi:plastocyanin
MFFFKGKYALGMLLLLAALAGGCSVRPEEKAQATGEKAAPAKQKTTQDEPAPEEAAKENAEPKEPAVPNQVVIDNFTFQPPRLTVKSGTKVTWVNRDDVPHTATSTAKPKRFDSGTLDTDQRFTHVFDKPGTYKYFCAVHPHMTATIIVK